MRTKLLKVALPFMAFMLAVAFAFATEQKTPKDGVLVTGYIFQDGLCRSAPKDCNNIGATPCTYLGSQVYRDNNGTSCSVAMTHRP